MTNRILLTCAAFAALSVPLAACDNDQPQTPQNEDVSMISPEELNAVDTAAGDVAPDIAEPLPAPTGGDAVMPQDIPDENIPPPPSREAFTDESCDYEAWVGQSLNEETIKTEGRPYRILKPGDPVTMDHNPDRINVEHEDGKVTRVWCG